jgi:hypothetical protein
VGTPEGARSAAARLERATRALAAVGRAPERVIDRAASYLSRLGGDARAAAEAPSLRWDPGSLRRTAALEGDGPVAGSPFKTLRAALGAVAQLRSKARDGQVFLVTRVDEGFATLRYTDDRLGKVDLKELRPEGLPLGGDAQAPQTWVVDGQGRLGRLRPAGGGTRSSASATSRSRSARRSSACPSPRRSMPWAWRRWSCPSAR